MPIFKSMGKRKKLKYIRKLKEKKEREKLVDFLVKLPPSESDVRRDAITAIYEIGDEKTIKVLIERMDGAHRTAKVDISVALQMIGMNKVGVEKTLKHLLNALATMERRTHSIILTTIVSFGDKVFDALVEALKHKNKYVRGGAIIAMGMLKKDNSLQYIINALEDEDIFVSAAAASLIIYEYKEAAQKHLIDALNSQSERLRGAAVRRSAIYGLEELRAPESIKRLEKIAATDENFSVRETAKNALKTLTQGKRDYIEGYA